MYRTELETGKNDQKSKNKNRHSSEEMMPSVSPGAERESVMGSICGSGRFWPRV